MPHLTAVSTDLGMTAFLVVWDGAHCLTLATAEPPSGNLVTQRPGTRHPLGVGAPGMAIAVALTTQCPYCIEAHSKAAQRAGATEKEVTETVMIAMALRAGGGFTHGFQALKFFGSEPE